MEKKLQSFVFNGVSLTHNVRRLRFRPIVYSYLQTMLTLYFWVFICSVFNRIYCKSYVIAMKARPHSLIRLAKRNESFKFYIKGLFVCSGWQLFHFIFRASCHWNRYHKHVRNFVCLSYGSHVDLLWILLEILSLLFECLLCTILFHFVFFLQFYFIEMHCTLYNHNKFWNCRWFLSNDFRSGGLIR